MAEISYNAPDTSQLKWLDPASVNIDDRSEKDHLDFFARLSEAINFYDHENKINGNWSPFLLKDPAILLAYISKTNFKKQAGYYKSNCNSLLNLIIKDQLNEKVSFLFNQILYQLTGIFVELEKWSTYMRVTGIDYDLRTYFFLEIQKTYSNYFWALIKLQEKLSASDLIPSIWSIDKNMFNNFNKLWTSNQNHPPYWEILKLDSDILSNSLLQVYNSITRIGDDVFSFYQYIIEQAHSNFNSLNSQVGDFPDTLLIRVFTKLLNRYKNQLNSISKTHLDFYYRDILKQTHKNAITDNVFINLVTSQDLPVSIPAGTLFNCGTDLNKIPVVFESKTAVEVNPAEIISLVSLLKTSNTDNSISLLCYTNPTPSTPLKNTFGEFQEWNLYNIGGNSESTVTSGCILSTPILYLKQGVRSITIEITLNSPLRVDLLQKVKFFLSTANEWISLTPDFNFVPGVISTSTFSVSFLLDKQIPPIVPFDKGAGEIESLWPLLKIAFQYIDETILAPQITELTITVSVNELTPSLLYTSGGKLSTKDPFTPFGPIPLVNSCFVWGSDEVFSKPVYSLQFQFVWSNLVPDLTKYYEAYNKYLEPSLPGYIAPVKQNKITKFFKTIWNFIVKKKPVTPVILWPFRNDSFLTDFEILFAGTWNTQQTVRQIDCQLINNKSADTDSSIVAQTISQETQYTLPVFSINSNTNILNTNSCFQISVPMDSTDNPPIYKGVSELQTSSLEYLATSSDGFMKMNLKNPVYGFGSQIYPQVVAYTSLNNANSISNPDEKIPKLPIPNIPYVPKASSFNVYYKSKCTFKFDYTEISPLQFFTISPFGAFKTYDSSIGVNQNDLIPINSSFLYDVMPDSCCVFLKITKLVTPALLSLYFEINSLTLPGNIIDVPKYQYLNNNTWVDLIVQSDGTNQLMSTGIITFQFQENVSFIGNDIMPGGFYWIKISFSKTSATVRNISYISANGAYLTRQPSTSNSTIVPLIEQQVKSTLPPNSKITKIMQPFPSFGYSASEDDHDMNRRVSYRIQSKDRIILKGEIRKSIELRFPEICYSQTSYNSSTNVTSIYVLPTVSDNKQPGAYKLYINEEFRQTLMRFIVERASPGFPFEIKSFRPLELIVNATITLNPGYFPEPVKQLLNQHLKIYLSPWIVSSQIQTLPGEPISKSKLVDFLVSFDEVKSVESISISVIDSITQPGLNATIDDIKISVPETGDMFISTDQHNLTFTA